MRKNWLGITLLMGLMVHDTAPAQGNVYLQAQQSSPAQPLTVQAYASKGTVFNLYKILEPEKLFSQKDISSAKTDTLKKTFVRKAVLRNRHAEKVQFGRVPAGVYLVKAGNTSQVLLVSDLGMVIKRDQKQTLFYTVHRETGQPLAAKIWNNNKKLWANKQGLLLLNKSTKDHQEFVARYGDHWAVSNASWNKYAAEDIRGHVYTDRPVYRQGHKVGFKGVLRDGKTLEPLANKKLKVRVFSPYRDEVYKTELTTDAYGGVSSEFELSAGAKLGRYSIELLDPKSEDEARISGRFQVEAYQKPEYSVTVTPSEKNAVQGDKISVKVSAKYLFGGAVSGAKVNYNITREPVYSYGWYDDGAYYGSDLVIREEARLNELGELDILLPLAKDKDGRMRYRIQARVEDESRKSVNSMASVTAYPAALNVSSKTKNYMYNAGENIPIQLETQDLKEQGQAATVKVELIQQDWKRVKGKWTKIERPVATTTTKTNPKGQGIVQLKAKNGGGYLIKSTVKDSKGRQSTNSSFVWVIKKGEDFGWNFRNLQLQLDQDEYKPGDTATVLVGNPKPGSSVLLTLEGDRLRRWVVLKGKGSTLTYSFKVTKEMSPNIYVAASSMAEGEHYSESKQVTVKRQDNKLDVAITSDKEKYKPGEAGKLKIQVKDHQGKGVAADLALSVVDEAIYLIRKDDSPSLLEVFEAEKSNVVGTRHSNSFHFENIRKKTTAHAGMADMAAETAPAEEAAKELAMTKGEKEDPVTPRQDFKDTLLWVPHLTTDAQGNAEVEVKYPDNLTTWRTTTRAQTKLPRFGENTHKTLVTKDVIARLSLPNFLVKGDQATIANIVNNTLPQPQQGKGKLELKGLTPIGLSPLISSGQSFTVGAEDRVRLDQPVRASSVGKAELTFTARTPGGNDALKLPLNVKARGYYEQRSFVGSAQQAAEIKVPANTNAKTLKLNVSITPSLLSAVAPALEYLVGYPYGCTEQTMSRFLPALLAKEALGAEAIPGGSKRLKKITEVGLARLEKFQHNDGGWNFWEHDESTLEMSAYVMGGLWKAQKVGANVDKEMLRRGFEYLKKQVAKDTHRPAERATAYRVLAEAGKVNKAQLLRFAKRSDLKAYSLAQVALSQHFAGQKTEAAKTLARLKVKKKTANSGNLVYWGEAKNTWYNYWDENRIQVTAGALEALAYLEPKSPLIAKASQWLLSNRQGPRWVSTQDTASVINAALALPKVSDAPRDVKVKLDGKVQDTIQVSGKQAGQLELGTTGLKEGKYQVSLEGAAPGTTFAAELSYAREPAQLNARNKGIALNRKYERLMPQWNAKKKRYQYKREPLVQNGQMKPVQTGDLVLVTLTVEPRQDARYMIISDPIPAGMKALDERSILADPDDYGWDSWNYWYSGRDLLDDRVDLYAGSVSGKQTMTYMMRAQIPGRFTALPSHAFLMYDPDVLGYSAAATFNIKDKQDQK